MRPFFHLLYRQFAWTYDWVAAVVSAGNWQGWVLSVLPELDGRVLELGHGPGHLQAALHAREQLVFGLDASSFMGRLAWRKLSNRSFSPRLVLGRAQSMPFPNQAFDRVVATFPSEYISDPPTIKEVWRVLTPGGRLVIIPFAWITGKRWLERAAAWLFRITAQAPPDLSEAGLTTTADRMLQPVRQVGFQVKIERRVMPGSIVVIILAEKPRSLPLR
ncbi:MAG TPA: methyltransferase domain-containing protein [Anaerolineales bacterium]|nr:methyltransferase domain-containing protein [Anaerolineales bacterium]